jgi:hypothetical protein
MKSTNEPIIKVCGCGLSYTQTEWDKLPYLGIMMGLELRNCTCGSTISIKGRFRPLSWRRDLRQSASYSEYEYIYREHCRCGRIIEVITQKDENSEYYTTIHIKCICGLYVKFELPVN